MFCYQCQETAKNTGCTIKGVCGKSEETANLQDLLIFALKGLSVYGEKANELGVSTGDNGWFLAKAIFSTITNANFDNNRLTALIQETLKRKDSLKDTFLAAYKEKNGQDFS
jgi:hydroxylamine reductase